MAHIDTYKEQVENLTKFHKTSADAAEAVLVNFITEPEILKLIEANGDEKSVSICKTIRESLVSKYKKVTSAQKHALLTFLIAKFGTAKSAIASAFGKTEDEMFALNNEEIIALKEKLEDACVSPTPVEYKNSTEEIVAMITSITLTENGSTDDDAIDGQLWRHAEYKSFDMRKAKKITQYFITKLIEINNRGN